MCTCVDSSLDYDDEPDAFSKPDAVTVKSGSSSGSELMNALRLSRHNSSDSGHRSDEPSTASAPELPAYQLNSSLQAYPMRAVVRDSNSSAAVRGGGPAVDSNTNSKAVTTQDVSGGIAGESSDDLTAAPPTDLASVLQELGLSKYLDLLEAQDIDLQVFLTLTDNDLKEIGVKYAYTYCCRFDEGFMIIIIVRNIYNAVGLP